MENFMRVVTYIAALGLLAVAGCNQSRSPDQSGQAPFNNGTRQSLSQPTTCSPADTTCGTGIGNPSVQSPVQKRELNVSPQ
jgi:hypothetical protein